MNYTKQPPIDFELPPLAPDDAIYTGSDEEDSVEEQEAQKRRIHHQGQYYLKGGQLFILSAQLYGPFDGGWVNPWAGKRKRKERDDGPGMGKGRMQNGGDTVRGGGQGDDGPGVGTGRMQNGGDTARGGGQGNDGPGVGHGMMQDGGDTAGGRGQGDESMTIPETTTPSRTWPRIDKAIQPEILETRLSSPNPNPAPEETLSTLTTLDPSAEGLQGYLKVVPPSKNLPAFEFPPLIRKDGGGGLKFEKAEARTKAQEERFRELSSKPTVDMQKSKMTSGSLAPRNYEESPAQRLQEFNWKRREIYQANYPGEGDDRLEGPSNPLPALFNKTRSGEVGREPEAIPSQSAPRKRGRLEAYDVPNNAGGGAGAPVSKRPLKVNNGNEDITSSQVMINAASPFNLSDHGTSSPISPTRSKPSLFSTIGPFGRSGSRKDGQQRPQLQPRNLGASEFNADSVITETLQFLKASQIENGMRKDKTNP